MTFDTFFRAATATATNPEGNTPYDYQRRLACGEPGRTANGACESRLIDIPTGLGKTAAVMLAWLWNRVAQQNPDWPRRLVYCLPMRTLVEQTQDEVAKWIENTLANSADLGLPPEAISDLRWLDEHSPVVLMGGEELEDARREWDIHPEKPAILIGTQDMLLSRALNRGYGMNRARWPMHFGLLNNDCLWVLDETQLMGVGRCVASSKNSRMLRHRSFTCRRQALPTRGTTCLSSLARRNRRQRSLTPSFT
ncbi:MAG: DEAD/DEAH box helicase [Opitutaceae bacterium]